MKTLITNNPTIFRFVFAGAGCLLFVLAASSFQSAYNTLQWWNEQQMEDEEFFVYNAVVLFGEGVKRGEAPRFVTDAEYFKDMRVTWEDFLWCRQNDSVEKYRTQFWSGPDGQGEFKKAGTKTLKENIIGTSTPTWSYHEQSIDPAAEECYLRWKVIGESKYGREVVYTGITDWFPVNL